MRRRVLRVEPERGESRHQHLPDRGGERGGGDAGVSVHSGAAGPLRPEAAGDRDDVVQRRVLPRRKSDEGGRELENSEDGVWGVGDIWDGGDLQSAVYLHGGAVSDGGEERGAGERDAGVADGGDIGAVRGSARRRAAVRGVRRVRDCGRGAGILLAGDAE